MRNIIIAFVFIVFALNANATTIIDTVPTTQRIGHLSTTWDDFMSVSPSDQIPLIQAPKASSDGNANLSFPIKLPEARQGHQPEIELTYNNEGGASWLGIGWDLSLSSFTLDTRWGVPTFDPALESEVYLFDGQQMGPVFHRLTKHDRESDRQFHLRKEGRFQKIIRHGTNPKNYWWEVREKDGVIKYYGGSPSTGNDATYTLMTLDGNITEWLLFESKDIYNNLIRYSYQKFTYRGGSEVYPLSITYNGRDQTEGDYHVDFHVGGLVGQGSRKDASLNCRTGMIHSVSQLINDIVVSYKGERIRSYQFDYIEGAFAKTLLSSVGEYDRNDELFYQYDFDYYNDIPEENGVVKIWDDEEEWNVPKDNVEVNAVSASNDIDFLESPTILGGAKSWNVTGGLAITVGYVVGNPATIENTVGANGGAGTSNGTGITSLVDINGDGLPDKVWKENGKLYYRANQKSDLSGVSDFGEKIELQGVTDFSNSNTISWNVGGELTVGVSEASVFVGFSHEENNTKIWTYFADFNGDDLLDIASDRMVYFNSIGPDGHPRFTKNSGDTPSPIFKGNVSPPVVVDPNEQQMVEDASPLHDAIREWKAPRGGLINISGKITLLEDSDPAIQSLDNKDGVVAMIQHNENELWRQTIDADDFTPVTPLGVGSVLVQRGDTLFFRIHSRYNGNGDRVKWDPEITYLNQDLTDQDVNGLPYYRYRASEDFLLSDQSSYVLSSNGTVEIKADLYKPALTDSLFLRFSGGIELDTAFAPSELYDDNFVVSGIEVFENTEYTVAVYAQTNVDWSAIDFRPTVSYTSFAYGSPANNSDGTPINSICPIVDFQCYNRAEVFGAPYIVPVDGTVTAVAALDLFLAEKGEAFFSLKSKLHPDSIRTVDTLFNPGVNEMRLEMDVVQGDTLYADMHYQYKPVLGLSNVTVASCEFRMTSGNTPGTCGVYSRRDTSNINGHHYRGWGQFAYNANDGRGNSAIILGDLEIDDEGIEGDTTLIDAGSEPDDVEGTNVTLDDLFIVMSADSKTKAWRGSDAHTFITANTISSSRNGNQDVDLSSQNLNIGDAFPALELKTKSYSNALAGEVGIAGGGVTFATSYSKVDIADMNGDRYPDHIYENQIQYTNPQGGLSGQVYNHQWGTHEADSRAEGVSIGGSFVGSSAKNSGASMGKGSNKKTTRKRAQGKSKLKGASSAFNASGTAVGLSGSLTFDNDWTKHTFIDINGDGLEDKVWEDGMVALNLGYSFAQPTDWGFMGIQEGDAQDIGGGVGINYVSGSIQAGLSASRTNNESTLGFMDINDDALVDRVISTKPMVVQMNTGNGFGEAITLNENAEMDAGYSIGESANGAFTFCIPFFFVRICFNPSTSIGQGTSSVGHSFSDIDGDGYVDVLSAHGDDGQLTVRSSNIGSVNMLSNISMPMKGEMSFTYEAKGNTLDMPYSKWVLSSYTARDGILADGESEYTYDFNYTDPFYDRHERQFYGFGTVEEIEYDPLDIANRRTVKTEYNVDNFYTSGLVKEMSIRGRNDTLFQKTEYLYTLRDVETGIALPPTFVNRDDAAAWPSLDQKKVTMTEGTDLALRRTYNYGYDNYGNELSIQDMDEAGSTQLTERTYYYDVDRYLHSHLATESIYGDGQLYRETEYVRDAQGNLEQLKETLDDQNDVITDMTYDEYGNVLTVSNPENYKGERLTFERVYDNEQHQYLVSEKNGYGYEESFTHEHLFNQMTSSTDNNGNTTHYEMDAKGRAASITYPYEVDAGLPYSVRFDYFPHATTAHAISYHYDPSHDTDLDLIEFEDGLQRSIQTKVRAAITNNGNDEDKYIVSGMEEYDAFGRKVKSFLPITESLSSGPILNLEREDGFSTTQYDVFDRPTRVVDPYNAVTNFEYSLDYTKGGQLALTTKTTNPFLNTQQDYFNARGGIIAERYDGPDGDIWRSYVYDGYSQVKNIYDTHGNETSYTYDLLGRRISVKVPDAGTTELIYDKANNLTERITATIRDEISKNGSIRYQYDKERLIQIDYPKHFQNKVQIHYGTATDSFNRVGRIWLQEDATGGREYFFDKNGNANKTIRTVMINRSKVFTYVSEAEYDTWGRVTDYIYPDGEALSYRYNKGGQLQQLIGTKNERKSEYLSYAGYDKYTDRVRLEYGNGMLDEYCYDLKGRLAIRYAKNSEGQYLLNEIYGYDQLDNLISKKTNGPIDETLGGSLDEAYEYDILQRMTNATGKWNGKEAHNYTLSFDYNDLNNLTTKDQLIEINDQLEILSSHAFNYKYEQGERPTRPSEVGGKEYSYDPNGNLLLRSSQSVFNFDQNVFDEENRLQGSSDNGYISRYTYDGFGVRTLKSHGESQGVFINGAPAGFLEHKVNYRVDVSPYFTIFEDDYRKHYFIDEMRILSKIGTGIFQSTISQGPEITAGGIDYKSRIQQYEHSILDYYGSLGVAPGPPTLLAHLGQPEINETTLPDATTNNPYNIPPPNWPNIAPPDTLGPPGAPVFYETVVENNETVPAGYNFTSGNITQEVEQFYYHYSNTGNTAFVTDLIGDARQHAVFLPSGERWIHKTTTLDETPYMFSGLQLDEETGFYDMGNIYYDPVTNVEQSIDPVLQHFGEETFRSRLEGDFYYDFAEDDRNDDPIFDNEILSSEKPDPFLSNVSTEPTEIDDEDDTPLLTYKMVQKAVAGQDLGWDVSKVKIDSDQPYAKEIAKLVPYLAARNDLSDPKAFKELVKNVIVQPERRKQIKAFKKFIRTKIRRKKARKVRKVRF